MKNKSVFILSLITIVIIIITIIIAIRTNSKKFLKPEFDIDAKKTSDIKIEEELQYSELKVAEGYTIGICNNLILDNDKNIRIYFTSLEENNVYVKLRIYDKKNNLLKETGLIKPGEVIEKVKVEKINKDKEIIIKVMSYDPNTYYSQGTINLNTKIIIGDK